MPIELVENSKGHLSVKLVVRDHYSGREQWIPYDTRLATTDPEEGVLIVFNSETGVYESFPTLAEAHAAVLAHRARLTRPQYVPAPSVQAKLGKKIHLLPVISQIIEGE